MGVLSTMQLKPINCPVCGEPAEIFGEGVARTIYDWQSNRARMYFTEFDGYAVRCSNCFEQTIFFNTIEEAIENWNDLSTKVKATDPLIMYLR